MVITPSTPGFEKKFSIMEKMGTTSLTQSKTLVIKNTYAHAKSFEIDKWRSKTRPTNKLHLNMKKMLNPKLQREKMIEIKESSFEEETQSRNIEGMILKALESIEEKIKSIPDISIKKFIDNGKNSCLQ